MRNKIYFITSVFFLFSGMLSAQNSPEKNTQFGFRVSPNLTWTNIKEGDVNNDGLGIGFSYGLTMDKKLSNASNAYLNVEAIITSMRNTISMEDSFYQGVGGAGSYYKDVKQEYKLQYLQIPISIKMKTNSINGMRYFFQAGLAPGFMLSREVRVSANPTEANDDDWFSPNASENNEDRGDFQGSSLDPERTFINDVGRLRVPLVLGAGFEYTLSGSTALAVGLRWDNGFTDIFKDDKVNGINNYLGLSVGIIF